MKRWKIYAGIIVITAVLGMGLCMGSKISVSKVSADVSDIDVSDINVSEAVVGADVKEVRNVDVENTSVDSINIDEIEKEAAEKEAKNQEIISKYNSEKEMVEEDIVKEEIVSDAVVDAIVAADPKAKKEKAYKNVLEEEVYITELVSIKSGVDYNISNWKECLDYLKQNYGILERDDNIHMDKIDSYIFAYNIVEQEKDMPEKAVNQSFSHSRTGYNPQKVTAYTNEYWENPNPEYFNFEDYGGDCANFVSQAVYAGGKKMYGYKWDDYKYWFCRSKKDLTKISSTWRGADAFGHYWRANAKGYMTFDGSHFTSKEAQQPVYDYTNVGDAISFLLDSGRPYHTVICSYKNRVYEDYPNGSKMIHFASHTGAHKWKSVYNYLKNDNTAIRVYDMY